MNRLLISISKYCLAVVLGLSLVSPLSAQAALHEALDFDGDGRADWSVVRPSENNWYIFGSAGSIVVQNFGLATDDFQTPGDFDGDNKGDIAVWRETNGLWYILNSSNNTFTSASWGIPGDQPVQRDYDGDGKTDLAVIRRANGLMIWWILQSSNGAINAYQWGLSGDFPVPGDYDGDGKYDMAVQRPGPTGSSQAAFFILASTDGFIYHNYAFSNDVAVPGDYDGDGKTDLAVVREGAGPEDPLSWYILRSSDFGFMAVQWGTTGTDILTQADYDGDGKTDIAIWRNSNTHYYVRASSTETLQFAQWGLNNDIPLAGYNQF